MSRARPGDEPTAVSEAEEQAFGGTEAEATRSFDELADRAREVTTGGWWREAGAPPVVLRPARASAASSRARVEAGADVVAVSMAAGQHDLVTLAHELAHALAGVDRGHDARYRAAAVDVATVTIGPHAGTALAAAFDQFGLDRATRSWPPPWRVAGAGFRMGPSVANVGSNHLNG